MQTTRPPMVFRGSRRRLRRLRVRNHWSVEMTWLLVGVMMGVWLAVRLVQNQNVEADRHRQPAIFAADQWDRIHRR